MMEIKILAFFAILAIYLKWNYGSPFVGGPHGKEASFIQKSIPLALFIGSAISLTIALMFKSKFWFFLFFSISAILLVLAPVVTFIQRRRR